MLVTFQTADDGTRVHLIDVLLVNRLFAFYNYEVSEHICIFYICGSYSEFLKMKF